MLHWSCMQYKGWMSEMTFDLLGPGLRMGTFSGKSAGWSGAGSSARSCASLGGAMAPASASGFFVSRRLASDVVSVATWNRDMAPFPVGVVVLDGTGEGDGQQPGKERNRQTDGRMVSERYFLCCC